MTIYNIRDFGAVPFGEPGGTTTANGDLIREAIKTVLSMGDGSSLDFPEGFWRMSGLNPGPSGEGADLTGVGDPTGAIVGRVTGVPRRSYLSKIGGDYPLFRWTNCWHIGFDGLSFHGRNSGARTEIVGGGGIFFRRQRNLHGRGFTVFGGPLGLDVWEVEDVHWYEPHAAGVQIGATDSYATDAPVINGLVQGFRVIASRAEAIEVQCHNTENTLRGVQLWSCNITQHEEYVDGGGGDQIDLMIEDSELDHSGDQLRAVLPQVGAIMGYVAQQRAADPAATIIPALIPPAAVGLPEPDPALPDPFLLAQLVDDGTNLATFFDTPITCAIRIKVENATRPIRPVLRRININGFRSPDTETIIIAVEGTDALLEDITATNCDMDYGLSLGGAGTGAVNRADVAGRRYGARHRNTANWSGRGVRFAADPGGSALLADSSAKADVRGTFVGGAYGANFNTSASGCVVGGIFIGQTIAAFRGTATAAGATMEYATVLGAAAVADLAGADQVVQGVKATGPGTGTAVTVRATATNARIEAVPVSGYTTALNDLGTGTQSSKMPDLYLAQTWSGDPAEITARKTEIEAYLARTGTGFWILPLFGQPPEVDPDDGAKLRFRTAIQAGAPLP